MGSIEKKFLKRKRSLLIVILAILIFFYENSFAETLLGQPIVLAKIGQIKIIGLKSIEKSELLYLLDIKEGQPLDANKLRAGIKRAFLKGIFDDISVEIPDPTNNSILITIKERPVVSSVKINGNRFVSDRELFKYVSVKKGQRYNAALNEKSARDMNEALKKKGFPENKVSYQTDITGSDKASITFIIEEGTPLIIRNLKILGDDEIVKKYADLKVGDIYDVSIMEKAANDIREAMKKKGIVGSRLTYKYEDEALIIRLSKGSELEVGFEGNSHIDSNALKKELPFFELNSFTDDLLEETVRRIISLYHKDGFADVQIAPIVSRADDKLFLKFYIHEGPRYIVDKIEFHGATLPAEKLRELLRLQLGEYYNPELISSDEETLNEFYRSLGYLNMRIAETEAIKKDDKVMIIFKYNEGVQIKVAGVNIVNNRQIPTKEILEKIPLKKDNPYNEIDILSSRRKIIDLYHKLGYLEVVISIDRKISNNEAFVSFNVKEGERSLFGKTIVIGNEDTKSEVVLRNLKHKEDEPFDSSILFVERQRLYRTGIFSGVEIQPSDRIGKNRDVLYRIEEGDAGSIEFGAGYAEYEKFRGFLGIGYKNLFGMNREMAFRTELSSLTRRFILTYFDPWFFSESVSFKSQFMKEYRKEINIDTQEVRYRLDRYLALAGVEKKFTDQIKADIYYELSHVNTYDVRPDIAITKEDTGTLIISSIKAGIIFDTRDNPFDPSGGLLAGVTYKLATSALLSETSFGKAQMYLNLYQRIFKGLTFAASFRGGYAVSFDNSKIIPLVERFFLGGRTTVRGYDQDMLGPKGSRDDPTGGNIFLMSNAEFRIHIWKGFGVVAFLDCGNVWQDSNSFRPADIKFTTGLGLRYNTPVGPIRLDYGLKLSRQHGEGIGAFHFSIGHAF